MKIRQGFVSNSSTTSFLIYGARVEDSELLEKAWELRAEGLESHYDPWDGGGWIGASWDSIRDDETGAQFKARIEGQLFSKFGIKPENCGTYEEAWRDG